MKSVRTEAARWFDKNGYEPIEPMDFYRAIFPAGELAEYSDKPRAAENNQEWKYNGILLENTHKSKSIKRKDPRSGNYEATEKAIWRNYMVLDDLKRIEKAIDQYGETESEFFIAPLSYLGRRRNKEHERWIYACIIEVDHPITDIHEGHRRQKGLIQLVYDWTNSPLAYAMPSAVVCSGSGVHLIYLLDRPYQISDQYQKEQWDNFRTRFINRIWNKLVTKAPKQYENHCQSFRVVGTRTKKGQRVEAFWLSKKRYSIDELFSQVEWDDYPQWETFEECIKMIDSGIFEKGQVYEPDDIMKVTKERMPKKHGSEAMSPRLRIAREKYGEDWYQRRIIERQPPKPMGQWICHRGLYDWFLREAKNNPYEGSRYNRVHALAEYAVKCGISYDEFKEDAMELYEVFKSIQAEDPFRYLEFVKARDEYFNEIAHKSTRDWIEKNTGVPMKPPAKRNGRKRKEHLQADKVIDEKGRRVTNVCKLHREDVLEDMRENGMITGRPSKQSQVEAWQAANPDGKKIDCHRETGLSRMTIDKWWKG